MRLLLKKVFITDPHSSHNRSYCDIFIEDGIVKAVAEDIQSAADETIETNNLHISPGWVDVFSHFCDPGFEYRETLQSGAAAAAAGGFTQVFTLPNTKPVIDSKSPVEYIVQQSKMLPVQITPLGAITRNAEGKELAEMYDMHNSGAVAFSDGLTPLQTAGILLKALQYVKAFDGVIVQVPDDKSIAPHGLVHEGLVSTRLGLPGKPAMAEELMVARDIKLARYAGSKLHFTGISSPKSLEYIKRAKDGGIAITCSVTPYHLFFCDEDLYSYDTNLKVNPPIRSKEDRDALREAVVNGTVDCIASHHIPQNWDSKTCEFEYAKYGMIGLQTVYPVLKTLLPEVSEERWLDLLGNNARKIFGLQQPVIEANTKACFTLFQPAADYVFAKENIKSLSHNSPFIGNSFKGRVHGIINGSQLVLNN